MQTYANTHTHTHTHTQLSAIFVPYGVNAGASGAVLGLIGVLFVELFQFWQIVDNALLELAKLLGFVIFLLALGTLPFIDNMAHIGMLSGHSISHLNTALYMYVQHIHVYYSNVQCMCMFIIEMLRVNTCEEVPIYSYICINYEPCVLFASQVAYYLVWWLPLSSSHTSHLGRWTPSASVFSLPYVSHCSSCSF